MRHYAIGQEVSLIERFKNRYPLARTAIIIAIVMEDGVEKLQLEGLSRLRTFNEVSSLT